MGSEEDNPKEQKNRILRIEKHTEYL